MVKLADCVPFPKLTPVIKSKFVPFIKTVVPASPLLGEKPEMVGIGNTLNAIGEVPIPAAFAIFTNPLTAPAGIFTVIDEPLFEPVVLTFVAKIT